MLISDTQSWSRLAVAVVLTTAHVSKVSETFDNRNPYTLTGRSDNIFPLMKHGDDTGIQYSYVAL
jgi:hypothetical protein